MDVLSDLGKPSNATLSEGADLAPLMEARGVKLPPNVKTSLVAATSNEPVGSKICLNWSSSPVEGDKWHCIVVRSPFENPFGTG